MRFTITEATDEREILETIFKCPAMVTYKTQAYYKGKYSLIAWLVMTAVLAGLTLGLWGMANNSPSDIRGTLMTIALISFFALLIGMIVGFIEISGWICSIKNPEFYGLQKIIKQLSEIKELKKSEGAS